MGWLPANRSRRRLAVPESATLTDPNHARHSPAVASDGPRPPGRTRLRDQR